MLDLHMQQQGTLFPPEAQKAGGQVPGFSLRPQYLNCEEERLLMAEVDCGPWGSDWRGRLQQ